MKKKIPLIGLALSLILLPISSSKAEIVIDDATTESERNTLIDMDSIFTDLEKKIMARKGFSYITDLGGYVNPVYISEDNPPITKAEMDAIDNWCKEVLTLTGADKTKTQKEKARILATYLKNSYPYDYKSDGSIEFNNKSSQIRSVPMYGIAQCAGFSKILVRLLDNANIESYVPFTRAFSDWHAVVRAYLDGKWVTIETTIGHITFPEEEDRVAYISGVIPYGHGPSADFYKSYGTNYNIFIETDIEDYLSKNNFNIYGY